MPVTTEWDLWLMTGVIFVPALFALALAFFPRGNHEAMRWWSLGGTLVTLVLTIFLFIDFYHHVYQLNEGVNQEDSLLGARVDDARLAASKNEPNKGRDLIARVPWISRFNIEYYLGVDGISMALILMTSALTFLAMIASWNIEKSVKGYCMLFLILETGMLGTFLVLDFFLFFVFWEIMLLPMYFLIGVWGGPRREYAAIKFFLYTMLGGIFIVIAILAFYFTDLTPLGQRLAETAAVKQKAAEGQPDNSPAKRAAVAAQREADAFKAILDRQREQGLTAVNSFDIPLLHKAGRESARLEAQYQLAVEGGQEAQIKAAAAQRDKSQLFSRGLQLAMFILLFVGFAIKVPVFPFHTWLPDAHVEAPTPISMILAGILLKMGGYGIIRIAYPICPWAAYELAWWVGLFGIINIVYGAFAAMAQTDFKRLVAYSSISHMGYVILGLAVWTSFDRFQYWGWGANGAMYQMIAHGITSAGMFFLVGVIYDRAHHRDLNAFGGLNNAMPLYSGISAVIFFGAMGLPGLCGFVGEFFTVLGTWNFAPAGNEWAGKVFAVLAALTVVLTAAYILWTIQRVFLGQNPRYDGYPDINLRELICVIPLVILAVLLGVWPDCVLRWMSPSVTGLVKELSSIFP